MNPSSKGSFAEALVMTELLRHGITVLVPWGGHVVYDFVADHHGLHRIQCKLSRLERRQKALEWNTASVVNGVKRRYAADAFDWYAVVTPESRILLLPKEHKGYLRLDKVEEHVVNADLERWQRG